MSELKTPIEKWDELTERFTGAKYTEKASVFNHYKDYINFLKQPITLGDLVPTNEKGEVLTMPWGVSDELPVDEYNKAMSEYQSALDRVKIEGWSVFVCREGLFELVNAKGEFIDYDGECFGFENDEDYIHIKTFNDLTGLGLKLKEK